MKNTVKQPRFTKNIITRDEAIRLCPAYVRYIEKHDHASLHEQVIPVFEKVRKGQPAITAHRSGQEMVYLRVTVSSIDSKDPRAVDGPIVRVGNGEYTWRVDGDAYAWPLPVLAGTRLSQRLAMLLQMGAKQAGSFEPDLALSYVEEQMLMKEVEPATAFLTWVHTNKKSFGSGNINQVWDEWRATL